MELMFETLQSKEQSLRHIPMSDFIDEIVFCNTFGQDNFFQGLAFETLRARNLIDRSDDQ